MEARIRRSRPVTFHSNTNMFNFQFRKPRLIIIERCHFALCPKFSYMPTASKTSTCFAKDITAYSLTYTMKTKGTVTRGRRCSTHRQIAARATSRSTSSSQRSWTTARTPSPRRCSRSSSPMRRSYSTILPRSEWRSRSRRRTRKLRFRLFFFFSPRVARWVLSH
jgi:hypothetical protein